MAIGLDDALLSWLVASAGDSLVHWLRDDPAQAAMREVVEEAVAATVAEIAVSLDTDQAEHLRASLLVRNVNVDDQQVQVANETELRNALQGWTAALDHPEFGESGYLSKLGVDPELLADALTSRIADGIRRNGRRGGALNPLAEWLWRDELAADVSEIKQDLSQLRSMVEPPASYGGGLPGGTPQFTGRREALDELTKRVNAHDPDGTVVAIHALDGIAGVGKTELALFAAHQHKHRYPDGRFFINLHGYTEGIAPVLPETALEELLRQAGVSGREVPLDLAGRQARWRALMARQRAVVLLDNAADVAQAQPLLPMSPGCLVLVTSRTRLTGLPGGNPLPLEVLPAADAVELFSRLIGPGRSHDPAVVAEVVRLVGHLPLAIEILAGRMRGDPTVTSADLASDLAEAASRLDETSAPGAGVRAAFQTSLQRLDPTHQLAFRLLGLHPGPVVGVPQFGALASLPTARARSILRTLADRNLIKPSPDRSGHRRYELHDLMREFAREQAAMHLPEEGAAALGRLTTWYTKALDLVEDQWNATQASTAAAPAADGVRLNGRGEARAWLIAEIDNLLALTDLATTYEAANLCMAYGHALWDRAGQAASAAWFFEAAERTYSVLGDHHREAMAAEHTLMLRSRGAWRMWVR